MCQYGTRFVKKGQSMSMPIGTVFFALFNSLLNIECFRIQRQAIFQTISARLLLTFLSTSYNNFEEFRIYYPLEFSSPGTYSGNYTDEK